MRRRLLVAFVLVAAVSVPLFVRAAWMSDEPPAWREWRTRQQMSALLAEEAPRLPPGERTRLASALAHAERHHGLDPLLLVALIERESRFNARARGPRGGLGLMQVRLATARDVASLAGIELRGAKDLFDPHVNVNLGSAYLAELRERFGTWEIALVAYNAGPTRVGRAIRDGRRPRSKYSRAILERWKSLSRERAAGEAGGTGEAGDDA